jgi:probable HAF family extracellular repeat protein
MFYKIRSIFHGCGPVLCILLYASPSLVQAQTQASCTFHQFTLSSNPQIFVKGVNDYGTVVGMADFGKNASPQFRAFIHYSNGTTTYWVPSGASASQFGGRNNSGVTTGAFGDASGQWHAVLRSGSTTTAISTPNHGAPLGINKYNSLVGSYSDSNGNPHGFKRYSNGSIVFLNYPGATGTFANGINDGSGIVGFYNGTDGAEHGFIYHNGQWAKLQFPNASLSTELYGISNAGVIVGQGQAHAFLYKNGTFKEIKVPGSTETNVRAIAPSGLIAGMADLTHGFLASCQ